MKNADSHDSGATSAGAVGVCCDCRQCLAARCGGRYVKGSRVNGFPDLMCSTTFSTSCSVRSPDSVCHCCVRILHLSRSPLKNDSCRASTRSKNTLSAMATFEVALPSERRHLLPPLKTGAIMANTPSYSLSDRTTLDAALVGMGVPDSAI